MKRLTTAAGPMLAIALVMGALSPAPAAFADAQVADQPAAPTTQKAVLVTGASTGIGRKITEVLASKGVFVYAGARKDSDIKELNAIENVKAVRLDVTIKEEIDAAVATITKEGRGLYGLVNNAGVAILAPLIEVDEDELEHARARLLDHVGPGAHHHAVLHGEVAGGLEGGHLLDFDEAHAAVARDAQIRVIAKGGHLDAGGLAGLQDGGAVPDVVFGAVDGDFRHISVSGGSVRP